MAPRQEAVLRQTDYRVSLFGKYILAPLVVSFLGYYIVATHTVSLQDHDTLTEVKADIKSLRKDVDRHENYLTIRQPR